MAAAASWKRRQMPAVRTRIKIRNDWRTHDVVLYAVPAANLIPLRGTRSVLLATTDPKVLYDEETFTGRPGCGKTMLVKRVVNELALPAGGSYTEEIRERGGRVGFKLVTLDG